MLGAVFCTVRVLGKQARVWLGVGAKQIWVQVLGVLCGC
jgi:hypothetical protein